MNRYVKKICVTVLLMILCFFCVPKTVHASYTSWVQDSAEYDDVYNSVTPAELQTPDKQKEANWAEKTAAATIYVAGNNMWTLTGMYGISVDSIILGRISSMVDVQKFGFELTPGNPYGIAGSAIYAIFRDLCFALFGVYLSIMTTVQVFKSGGQARSEYKSKLTNFAILFMLLYLMPLLIDFTIFVRDSFVVTALSAIGSSTNELGIGFIETFETKALETNTIIDSLLFLMAAGSGFTFAWNYTKIAMTQMVLYMAFPFIALFSNKQKDLLSKWCMKFFSNIAIPLIDACLLLAPLAYMKYSSDETIVQLFMYFLIMPSRNVILALFGNQSDISGGGRMGALIAGLALRAASGSNNHSKRQKDISNGQKAAELEKIADLEDKAMKGGSLAQSPKKSISAINQELFTDNAKPNSTKALDAIADTENTPISEALASTDSKTSAMDAVSDMGAQDTVAYGPNTMESLNDVPESMSTHSGLQEPSVDGTELRVQNLSALQDETRALDQKRMQLQSLDQSAYSPEEVVANEKIQSLSNQKSQLIRETSDLDKQLALLSSDDTPSVATQSQKQHLSSQIEQKHGQMRTIDAEISQHKGTLSGRTEQKNQIRQEIAQHRSNISDYKQKESSFAQQERLRGRDANTFDNPQDYLKYQEFQSNKAKLATYRNFDNGLYDNVLSTKEKAEFYRERQKKEISKKVLQVAGGSTLGIAGGLVGLSVSGISGADDAVKGTIMGAAAGGILGNKAGSFGASAASTAGDLYVENKNQREKNQDTYRKYARPNAIETEPLAMEVNTLKNSRDEKRRELLEKQREFAKRGEHEMKNL